jgi:hypothetical protein
MLRVVELVHGRTAPTIGMLTEWFVGKLGRFQTRNERGTVLEPEGWWENLG